MNNMLSLIKNASLTRCLVTRLQSEERGQSAVEAVVALVLFVILTFGMIDVGRCVYTMSVVKAAAQEGARAGIIDSNNITSAIEAKMVGLDMNNANIVVNTMSGNIVEVVIDYNFEFLTPVMQPVMSTMQLNANASMVAM